jgi:hypothetical protein
MGQYYLVCNITKREYLHPHSMGDGLKLLEFGLSGMGTMAGLSILLADGNGRGGGDISEDPLSGIVGRWAGDRIVIAGDYADTGRFVTKDMVKGLVDDDGNPRSPKTINIHTVTDSPNFKDISFDVIFALMADSYVRGEYIKSPSSYAFGRDKNIIPDFNAIHEQLVKGPADMTLLVGHLKSNEGKAMLEKFLKRTAKEKKELKKAGCKECL